MINMITNFNKFIFYLKESTKEVELNRILDKISKSETISKGENDFLSKYDSLNDEELRDLTLMTMHSTFEKITELLEKNKKVICNLYDRDGLINKVIDMITNDYDSELCIITFLNGEDFKLRDNFLYNIIYNMNNNTYSLEAEDEYFEKIPIKND